MTVTVSWRFVAIFSHSVFVCPNEDIATKFIELEKCSTTVGIAPTVVSSEHCH